MSINLMPWREARRKQLQKDFLTKLGFAALAALAVTAFLAVAFSSVIAGQERRNTFLEKEIAEAKKNIEKVKDLRDKKDALLTRKGVIEKLQADRDQLAFVLHELARNSVDGVIIKTIEHKNDGLEISGISTSNPSVAAFISNLEKSSWFDKPEIIIIQNKSNPNTASTNSIASRYGYDFKIKTGVKNPNSPIDEEDGESNSKTKKRSSK